MVLAFFVFIAWIIISVYMLVPKRLSKEENLLLFFFLTMIILNLHTILDLNLKVILHSNKLDLFISVWIIRNIILPLSLIIFVNLIVIIKSKINKVLTIMLVFITLYFIELLAVWNGMKIVRSYLPFALLIPALMLISFLTMKLVVSLPEKRLT